MARTVAAITLTSLLLVASGCGSQSMNSLVSDHYRASNPRCKAVGVTDAGKVYSCQSDSGGTLCLIRDGNDLLPGSLEARRAGVSC